MRIAIPQEITSTELVSSTIAEDEYPLWTAGTYTLGTIRIYDHQVWEVTADPDTSDRPDDGYESDPQTWVRLGWTNRYRMFRDGVDSKTEAGGDIEVVLSQTTNNGVLAVLGLQGFEVKVELLDDQGDPELTETKPISDYLVDNPWDWCTKDVAVAEELIFDIPIGYAANDVRVTISGFEVTDPVACGRLVLGEDRDLGITDLGTSVSNLSYSGRERDGFGNLTLKPVRTVKLVDYQVTVETPYVSTARSVLDSIDAIATLFIGTEEPGYGATIAFGTTQDFRLVYEGPTLSDMTLTVQGF